MVERLSVMITESINKPDPFALSLSTRTTTQLRCPPRATLLVIMATMVWGKPAPSWSACTTSAGRRFTASAVHRTQPFQFDSRPRQTEPGGAADRRPESRRFHVHEDRPALLD